MSSFTTPLRVEYLDGRTWRLCEPFEYHIGEEDSGEIIHIPSLFITDFASIPRPLWNLLPPTGRYGKAAVVHDACYQCSLYPRKRSDQILLEGMQVLGVDWLTRTTIYSGVRVGGRRFYGRGSLSGMATIRPQKTYHEVTHDEA